MPNCQMCRAVAASPSPQFTYSLYEEFLLSTLLCFNHSFFFFLLFELVEAI